MSSDKELLDWLEGVLEYSVLESAFELDGGFHVTLSTLSRREPVAIRNCNSFREGLSKLYEILKSETEVPWIKGDK